MPAFEPMMSTDQVSARDRVPYWSGWIRRLFHGLRADLYGDTEFDGHMATEDAGDVVLRRGFNHPAHFSRAFKLRFGVAPSEWRARDPAFATLP